MDTSVDRNLPDDQDSAYIFSKVIGCELSHGSSADFYLRYQMNFESNAVQTKAPQFMELGIPAVNTSNDFGIQVTPDTRTRSPMDGSHWSASDHIFGEATAVRISAARSEQKYSYKTDFQIWRGNQYFGNQNISMS